MVVMTVDTEQSFAVNADLVSRESGLRRLIEMSGSLNAKEVLLQKVVMCAVW